MTEDDLAFNDSLDDWRTSSFAKNGSTLAATIEDLELGALSTDADRVSCLIQESSVAVAFGPSGCGKSFLAVELAVRVAGGLEFLSKKIDRSPVIYVAAEDYQGIRRRLAARALAAGIADAHIAVASALDLLKAGEARRFAKWVQDYAFEYATDAPPLVIFDTLTTVCSGNQDASADMAPLFSSFHEIKDRLGASILVTHHSGLNDTHRPRGSSVIGDRADVLIRLRSRGAIGDCGEIETVVTKNRNGPAGASITFMTSARTVERGVFPSLLTAVVLSGETLAAEATRVVAQQTSRPTKLVDAVFAVIDRAAAAGPVSMDDLAATIEAEGLFANAKPENRARMLSKYIDKLKAADRIVISPNQTIGPKNTMVRTSPEGSPDHGPDHTPPLGGVVRSAVRSPAKSVLRRHVIAATTIKKGTNYAGR